MVLGLSPGQVRNLDHEFDEQLRGLGALAGVSGPDRLSRSLERPGGWVLYGRLGVLNFQNRESEVNGPREKQVGGMRISLKRSGPKLTGKIYVGIHRRW